jgi:hypothetical protein
VEVLQTRRLTQTGSYQNLPPTVIIDLDETAIDNSAYEAGLVLNDTRFNPKTWDGWTKAEQAKALPGAVEFANYAYKEREGVFTSATATRIRRRPPGTSRGARLSDGRQRSHFACKRTGPNGPREPRVHVSPKLRKTTACC